LADIETESFGLDPEAVQRAIGPRTRGIVGVDYAGHPCRVHELRDLARARGLFLLEDAAHSFGAAVDGVPVGGLADATAFSFYATKCITTGEGGLVTCTDADLAQRVRLLGYHGMQRDAWKRYTERGRWYYEVELPGYKCNMTDVQAALGMSQLRREPSLRAARAAVVARYASEFAGEPGLELPAVRPGVEHAWHLYVVRLRLERLRIDRDRFAQALRDEGVVPRVNFIPYHRHPVGRELGSRSPLPKTDDFADRCLSLPLFPYMPAADVDDVVTAMRKLLHHYAR
jgi:dTDP-4-amino-4,6-dideoxygalactose transaminase